MRPAETVNGRVSHTTGLLGWREEGAAVLVKRWGAAGPGNLGHQLLSVHHHEAKSHHLWVPQNGKVEVDQRREVIGFGGKKIPPAAIWPLIATVNSNSFNLLSAYYSQGPYTSTHDSLNGLPFYVIKDPRLNDVKSPMAGTPGTFSTLLIDSIARVNKVSAHKDERVKLVYDLASVVTALHMRHNVHIQLLACILHITKSFILTE